MCTVLQDERTSLFSHARRPRRELGARTEFVLPEIQQMREGS